MKMKFFPEADNTPSFTPEEMQQFCRQSDALEERAVKMENDCCLNAQSVSKAKVAALAKDTYCLAVQLYEARKAKGESLSDEEQAMYQLFRKEIQNHNLTDSEKPDATSKQAGSRRSLAHAVGMLGSCIEQIREQMPVTSEKEAADSCIIEAGNHILPGYAELVDGFFGKITELFVPHLTSTLIDIAEAQAECALFYQDNHRTVDKSMASEMLDIADYGYLGHPVSVKGEFQKLSASEVPEKIRPLYDESQGLLTCTRGLRVWLGKKENAIAVAYSGTNMRNMDMLYADMVQLSEPSILYLKAAGLLHLLLQEMTGHVYVTGHSLGGGLTEFAIAANVQSFSDRMTGYAYNPAGLSMASLRHLGEERLKAASRLMWVFMTSHDPVSAIGGKIGCLTTLPESDANGHGIEDVKACMQQYLFDS